MDFDLVTIRIWSDFEQRKEPFFRVDIGASEKSADISKI